MYVGVWRTILVSAVRIGPHVATSIIFLRPLTVKRARSACSGCRSSGVTRAIGSGTIGACSQGSTAGPILESSTGRAGKSGPSLSLGWGINIARSVSVVTIFYFDFLLSALCVMGGLLACHARRWGDL
jgi:hypothetical protein